MNAPPTLPMAPAAKRCFAPQPPLASKQPGITTLACFIPLPLIEFASAPVAVAATLLVDSNVTRYDAITIELCGNPFGLSLDEPIPSIKAISNSGAANSVFEQLYSMATAIHACTKTELGAIFKGFGISLSPSWTLF
jgi:hypothetical protein